MRWRWVLLAFVFISVITAGGARAQEGRGTHRVDTDAVVVEGEGTLDRAALLARIEAERPAIQRCHAHALRSADVAGMLTVRLTLSARGRVSAVRIEDNTTPSPALAACVLRALGRMTLSPEPGSEVTVRVPIVFETPPHDVLAGSGMPAFAPTPVSRVTIDEHPTQSGPGAFSADAVLRLLRTRTGLLRGCFEHAVTTTPTLAGGDVTLTLTVEPAGTVRDVHASGLDAVNACVERAAQRFRFEPGASGGDATFVFRITFERLAAARQSETHGRP